MVNMLSKEETISVAGENFTLQRQDTARPLLAITPKCNLPPNAI